VRSFLEAWAVELRDVRALRVRFDQTKELRILRRPRTSHGVAVLKGKNLLMRVRNEAGETETELLVEGDHVKIHYPQLKRLEIYPVVAGRKSQAPFPLSGSDVEALPRTHRLGLRVEGEKRVLTLEPRDDADACKEIRLTFRGVRLEAVQQESRNGDRVRIEIAEFSVNPEIADAELRLDVPEGTRVVHIASGSEK
jgi:outer membrane lipoprotein-sorting protein